MGKPTNVPAHCDDIFSSATCFLDAIDKSSDLELNRTYMHPVK